MTDDAIGDLVESEAERSSTSGRLTAAPYMAGKSFTNMFERYAADGLPDVFDKSFFGNISGSTVAQTRATMRYFDLIDDSYAPTSLMRELVDADEAGRKDLFRTMMEEKFADELSLSMNSTSGQLAKVFSERGLGGATVDKAVSFYLHMLDYLGMPYSSHFKKRRPTSNGGATRRRKVAKQAEIPPHVAQSPPRPKLTTEEEQKAAYVQTLLDLAKRDGADADIQDRIFDRIEKALGLGGAPASNAEGHSQTD